MKKAEPFMENEGKGPMPVSVPGIEVQPTAWPESDPGRVGAQQLRVAPNHAHLGVLLVVCGTLRYTVYTQLPSSAEDLGHPRLGVLIL